MIEPARGVTITRYLVRRMFRPCRKQGRPGRPPMDSGTDKDMTADSDRIAAARQKRADLQAALARMRADLEAQQPVPPAVRGQIDRIATKLDRLAAAIDAAARAAVAAPVNGAPPVTPEENARLAALPPEVLAQTDLTVGDTAALFSDDYMQRLAAEPIKGEGHPQLKDLMREIEKGLSGPRRPEVMAALAQIVGIPPTAEKLDVDYDRFLVVRKQQAVNGTRKDEDVPELDEGMHPDFRGSRSQLMFGKVLGDAFGIHEVFAALLSPTGGLVGPGNWLIPGVVEAGHLDPDNPVALHGTVHDAAGYLGTFHGEGPGYNYRNSDIEILGTGNPLSGQVSGIAYWVEEVGEDYALRRVEAAVVEVEKRLQPVRDAVAAEIDLRVAQAKRAVLDGAAAAEDLAREAETAVTDIADAIDEARDRIEDTAVETFDTAARAIENAVPEEARRKLEAAWNFIWS